MVLKYLMCLINFYCLLIRFLIFCRMIRYLNVYDDVGICKLIVLKVYKEVDSFLSVFVIEDFLREKGKIVV